jgi:ATP-dependent helicase/nuclease subunit A
VLDSPGDTISRAAMVRYFLLATYGNNVERAPLSVESQKKGSSGILPEGNDKFLERVRELTLFEAIESIIEFYGIGQYSWNMPYLSTFQDLVINFPGTGIQKFLEWWESTGVKKSVALPANQDAARVLTIHKAKGLEFKVVIIPFISWNLDHKNLHQPILWVKPDDAPFDELKILPVRYCKDLDDTFFAADYRKEKLSVYIDNINLLYVATTRAMDALCGFAPLSPSNDEAVAGIVHNAITSELSPAGDSGIILKTIYDADSKILEFGEIPDNKKQTVANSDIISKEYSISRKSGSLRLKMHSESYFSAQRPEIRSRIDYGKLMHEVFESIDTPDDIPPVINRMVLEGKIPASDSSSLSEKLLSLVGKPPVSLWFIPSGKILREAEILLPSGSTKRPDRVIISGNKAVVVDFKFGEERRDHSDQIRNYIDLLAGMGYKVTEGYLWYVDKNEIIKV